MALTWPAKEAAEVLAFQVDWTARLAGDTITASTLAAVAGAAVIDAQSHTTVLANAFISGGTAGETCVFTCIVETAGGFTLEETIVLPIAAQELAYADESDPVYQTVEDIDRYMVSSFGDSANAWLAAERPTKQRAAVTATRVIERQVWQGQQTVPTQALAFPRTGLSYPDGASVDPASVPRRVLEAACEIAGALVSGSDLQNVPSTFNTTKSLKAGSVEIVNFRTDEDLSPRFPQVITELIGLWLGGLSTLLPVGSRSTGTCRKTIFNEQYDFTKGF